MKKRLELVLEMNLNDLQVEALKRGWNAFYNSPEQYKNSIVVDMVKQYLNEHEMKIQTVQDLLNENEHLMESDIYNFYDLKEDGTKIVNVYSMGDEGGVAGVEYEDGTYCVVGCRTDRMVETKQEMIDIVETGF